MAAVTPVSDQAEILALIEAVLTWDPYGVEGPPDYDLALSRAEQFTAYGRVVAEELRTLCRDVPADCDVVRSARSTLGEADRRLYLPPPSATRPAAVVRAQNIVRLVHALLHATAQVHEARARSAGRDTPHTTTKGALG
ncbi:hypothetical protein U9R90_26855 [Streptomyces sp. E11-3]|uniref:DUF6415 family natural product biosynthesis protein n=1 Tax=Streptomyces sp. E11-3 TaxID=3110112 RepID=UPI00397FD99A